MTIAEAAGSTSGTRISGWRNHPWDTIIRPLSFQVAEKIASFAERAVRSGKIKYSQQYRNGAYIQWSLHSDNFSSWEATYADCSSFASLCAMYAIGTSDGLYVDGNSPWTGNMAGRLFNTGMFTLVYDNRLLNSSDYLHRGDILLNTPKETGHAAIALEFGPLTCFPDTCAVTLPAQSPTIVTVKPGMLLKFEV